MSWAIVTGASSGIGESVSLGLAQSGLNVFLIARRKEHLRKLAEHLQVTYPKQTFLPIELDVCDSKKLRQFVEQHSTKLAELEVLINNAGLAAGTAKVQDLQRQDLASMLDTNVKALIELTSLVLPAMIQNRRGFVVNLGSVAGKWTYSGGAVYCATKFAVRGFSEALRQDLHGTGVRVCNIEPGMVETEFSLVRFNDPEKAAQVYAGMKPLTATDIAETILWVVKQPQHVNIQEVVVFPTDQSAIGMVERRKQ
jgi:3-hydroxy acid dehydrogenase/malonic semialdehyde reductase